MAMNPSALAQAIKEGLEFGDKPTTAQLIGEASAIIAWLATGTAVNAPGTVTGNAPPTGGPLAGGAASNGTLIGLVPSVLVGFMQSYMGFPSITPELQAMATAITTHFLAAGKVSFTSITGVCTNTLVAPGVLIGAGAGGKISNIDGDALVQIMSAMMGKTPPSKQHRAKCVKLVEYIKQNATVTYAGTVTGVCSAGGGPVIAGTALGGLIT